jgi:hypothetical protein
VRFARSFARRVLRLCAVTATESAALFEWARSDLPGRVSWIRSVVFPAFLVLVFVLPITVRPSFTVAVRVVRGPAVVSVLFSPRALIPAMLCLFGIRSLLAAAGLKL